MDNNFCLLALMYRIVTTTAVTSTIVSISRITREFLRDMTWTWLILIAFCTAVWISVLGGW